jgi:hypothetical protein
MRREISDAEQKDRLKHPNCQYSSSISKSCSNNAEGRFVCETIESLVRFCRGEEPKLVFEKKSVGDDASGSFKEMFDFGSFLSPQRPQRPLERGAKESTASSGSSSPLEILEKVENEIFGISNSSRRENKYAFAPPQPEVQQFDFPHSDVFDKEVEKALKRGRPQGPVERA